MSSNGNGKFQVGDLVTIDPVIATPKYHNVVFRVEKLLPVNVDLAPVNGGRGLRTSPNFLRPASDTAPAASAAPAIGRPYEAPLPEFSVVTVASRHANPGDLYVIKNVSREGRYSAVKLGGDNGLYLRGLIRSQLTVIDPSRITIAP